ncbi:penicillin-binding protein 2 [Thiomicrorhabdus sp. 6S2-11]|uniref:Penicillin-binding protein 2 n=1 Tax=Thiomicrorhabdus marina TaxID=2818442 RepID=A0ABS3Q4E7_9GAMM|nr:penicillin-binding protein 2 [Thiomicrorhabdus marina]MBO1927215.1 penicillin-binding protein 2 [Thiomicrorhabdus marina]
MSRFFSRDILIFLLISAMMLVLLGRAFHNQIIEADTMREEADDRHERTYRIPAVRGEIYDRNGSLLALSTPMVAVQVDPKKIKEELHNYQQLMQLLDMNSSRFMQLVRDNRDKKLSFVRNIESEKLQHQIEALKLPGVFVKNIEYRYQAGSDKNSGRSITVTKQMPSLWVQESIVSRYLYLFERLGKALNIPPQKIYRAVYADKDRHLYIKRQLTPDYREKVDSLRLPYVFVTNEYKRFYTNGEVNANLIGFTNIDGIGKDGLERAYDAYLQGQDGAKVVIKDVRGNVINTIKASYTPGEEQSANQGYANGGDIQLSIDQNIQYYTYKALMQVMYKHQPKSASAIVLDAKSGEILAMANVPSYHVNRGSDRKGAGLRNRAVTDFIEPGSTIKPFIIAKAMDMGLINQNTVIDTKKGVLYVQGNRIKDTSRHGELTPEGIIQKSSNVGTAKIALMMDKHDQYELYKQLGFDRDSGIYFPGEAVKSLKHADFWREIDQASMSYGYGFNINLLNLARAYTVFANDGVLKEVSIFARVDESKKPVEAEKRIYQPEVARQVRQMMAKVTQRGGTALQAQIPGYQVAGKTGTSHKTSRKGGYQQNTYMSMFAGMVPASNPDMIMVVAVDEPSRGDYYGGKVAAPVFKEVMQQALRLRNIAPDMLPADHPELFLQQSAPFKGQIAHNGQPASSVP